MFVYVVMDGFDLGLGILFPAVSAQARDRDRHHEFSVAPVWDGNETWLVLGGGGLFAAFPLAYAVHDAGAVCTPVIAMLLGLVIFRGRRVRIPLARRQRERNAPGTSRSFAGSLVATLAQGVALGALLQGVHGRGPRLCRRLVGLADAVQHPDRRQHW